MPKQLEMKGCAGHGGKRRGAGRPNKTGLSAHTERERINEKAPLHINTKIRAEFPSIRRKEVLKILQGCCARAKAFGLHVIHYSLQSNHIHLIVEARNNAVLGKGMQSLKVSFAKAIKKQMKNWKDRGRVIKGPLFLERYHLTPIKSPTQMKRTLRYVLLNHQKHSPKHDQVDRFSSARVFFNWDRLLGKNPRVQLWDGMIEEEELVPADLGLSPPRSWLAREGWMRAAG
jgi:REP element-mobilizing transposase RayT